MHPPVVIQETRNIIVAFGPAECREKLLRRWQDIRQVRLWPLLIWGAALTGCGGSSSVERLPVHGTVALAGGETISGSISFVPAKGASGPAATVSLIDGEYQFDRSNGPGAGPHQVIVQRVIPKSE